MDRGCCGYGGFERIECRKSAKIRRIRSVPRSIGGELQIAVRRFTPLTVMIPTR